MMKNGCAALPLLLITILLSTVSSCSVNQQKDAAIIKKMIEDNIVSDCDVIAELAGVFFEDQQKPPNTVRVTYQLQFPLDLDCEADCPCWKNYCNHQGEDSNCLPDYCCIEKTFLWGRIPNYVQDNTFRQLTMCNLVVGGVKEKIITIPLNISKAETTATQFKVGLASGDVDVESCFTEKTLPCSWCHKTVTTGTISPAKQILDSLFSVPQASAPLDKALLSVTAKLQGYAAKLERLDWLQYDSDLAVGYSAPYSITWDSITRLVLFLLYYISFQMIIFMLIYKYRYRIYNKICQYMNESSINMALFWSFILTTILAFSCVLVITLIAGGICMSMLQIAILGISLLFGIPHTLVTCFRMKKSSGRLIYRQSESCSCILTVISTLLFIYIFLLPHIAFFWLTNFIVSFIAKPFSYLLLFVYFCMSGVFIWVANAIGLHLMFPLALPCSREGTGCRRHVFAIFLLISSNCLNFWTWGFIQVYFYDRRAQAASFITILPGITFTLLGWYLSGDLVKLFDMWVTTALPSKKPTDNEALADDAKVDENDIEANKTSETNYHDFNTVGTMQRSVEESSSLLADTTHEHLGELPRQTYKCSRLKRVAGALKRPTSVITLNDSPKN